MFDAKRKRKASPNHRNPQLPLTRRNSVHPAVESNGDNQTKRTPERRGPYKLCDALIKRFCENLRSCPGLPIEAVCDSLGVGRATFYEWLEEAKQQPGTIYERFANEITEALGFSWRSLHELAIKAKPEQILFRRYASFYPAPRAELDVSSAGMPVMPGSFNVLLELHREGETADPADLEFKIVEMRKP
jgi:hypothetical protein